MAASVVMIAKGEKYEPKPVIIVVPAREPRSQAAEAVPESVPRTVELTEEQAAAFQAEASACSHRTKDSTCNCRQFRCGLGRGVEGVVTDWNCLGCLGYVDSAGQATGKGKPRVAAPSLVQRIGNVTKAAGRVIDQVVHGGEVFVSTEEAARRFAICHACMEFYKPSTGTCEHPECGCFLSKKTTLATERCPIGKWPKLTEPTVDGGPPDGL